jgi:hypothetical protein
VGSNLRLFVWTVQQNVSTEAERKLDDPKAVLVVRLKVNGGNRSNSRRPRDLNTKAASNKNLSLVVPRRKCDRVHRCIPFFEPYKISAGKSLFTSTTVRNIGQHHRRQISHNRPDALPTICYQYDLPMFLFAS